MLRGDLKQYEGLFVASRYAFEKGNGLDKYPLSLLMDLCSFLQNFDSEMTGQQFFPLFNVKAHAYLPGECLTSTSTPRSLAP